MFDLFESIPKGSLLIWYVQSEDELPKRKELIRLLRIDSFAYYKTDGHHRRYIHLLGRIMDCLYPVTDESKRGYMRHKYMSHFLFTAQRVEHNSFFLSKYPTQCLGAFHVTKKDFEDLELLLHRYDQATHWVHQIHHWPNLIQDHKMQLQSDGIQDAVIKNLDISALQQLTQGYGFEAVSDTQAHLQAWYDQFFWKSRRTGRFEDTLLEAGVV